MVVVLGLVLQIIIQPCHVTSLFIRPKNIRKSHEWHAMSQNVKNELDTGNGLSRMYFLVHSVCEAQQPQRGKLEFLISSKE